MTLLEQAKAILRSRKFWALVGSLAVVWGSYAAEPTPEKLTEAIRLTVLAIGSYTVATGLEGPKVPPVEPPGPAATPE